MMEKCKKENGEIKEAIEQLEEMSADERERELYDIREKTRLNYNTEMNAARRKGLAIGKAEGLAEGLAEGRAEGRAYNIPINVDTIKEGYPILCA